MVAPYVWAHSALEMQGTSTSRKTGEIPVAADTWIKCKSYEKKDFEMIFIKLSFTIGRFAPSADVEDVTDMVGLGRGSHADGLDFSC